MARFSLCTSGCHQRSRTGGIVGSVPALARHAFRAVGHAVARRWRIGGGECPGNLWLDHGKPGRLLACSAARGCRCSDRRRLLAGAARAGERAGPGRSRGDGGEPEGMDRHRRSVPRRQGPELDGTAGSTTVVDLPLQAPDTIERDITRCNRTASMSRLSAIDEGPPGRCRPWRRRSDRGAGLTVPPCPAYRRRSD